MPSKIYKIGQGTTVSLAPAPAGNTAPTYVALDGIKSVQLASIETAQVEITNFGSGGMREYVNGLKDASEATFSGLWDAGSTQDTLIRTHQENNARIMAKVSVPNSTGNTFNIVYTGNVSKYENSIDFENVGESTITIKVSAVTTSLT